MRLFTQPLTHGDLAAFFHSAGIDFLGIVDLIKTLDADVLADHHSEFNYSQQSRRLSEILEAEHLLFRQVWYDRHGRVETDIERGIRAYVTS
jgi:hypothetical protein